MNRRAFLTGAGVLGIAGGATPPRSKLGVATTSYHLKRNNETLQFLEYCHSIGAAGIQAGLTSLEPAYLDKLERRAKDLGMYIEVMTSLPQADMGKFVATVEAAKKIGAVGLRAACLSGRRYERFTTLPEWQQFITESKASLARAVPVVSKLKVQLAIENHKDWIVDEMIALLKAYSTPYLGACLDTGNNIALLESPMEVIERLMPYAISAHIKDMGVAEYEDGFLLSEVPIGQGILDIPKIVKMIQEARPARMSLEMMTRDPLKVPVFTDKYWITFPDRGGVYLARTLRMVREKKSKLPTISGLSRPEQLKLEDENVRKCLASIV